MTDKKKIIIRRGSGVDLPGKPRAISPKQWNRSLEEGEMAYSEDDGRIFVGPKVGSNLPQSRRLQYPYQNIEVIGENSVEAFEKMHGDRMREGDNRDYYFTTLVPFITDPSGLIASTIIVAASLTGNAAGAIKSVTIANDITLMDITESLTERDDSTPYRYWRLVGRNDGQYWPLDVINEIGFHETIDGPDISGDATIVNANAMVIRSPFQNDHIIANVFDNNLTTRWHGFDARNNFNNPLSMRDGGLVVDFTTPRVVRELSLYKANSRQDFDMKTAQDDGDVNYYEYTQIAMNKSLQVSQDRLNWGDAYVTRIEALGSNQYRHVPDREIPVGTTRGAGIHIFSTNTTPATARAITEIVFYDENDQPITDFTVSGGRYTGFGFDTPSPGAGPTRAFDGDPLTEHVTNGGVGNYLARGPVEVFYAINETNNISSNPSTGASQQICWVFFDSPKIISRFTIMGPADTTLAPNNFTFWAIRPPTADSRDDFMKGYLPVTFYDELNWTSKEVRSYPVSLTGVSVT